MKQCHGKAGKSENVGKRKKMNIFWHYFKKIVAITSNDSIDIFRYFKGGELFKFPLNL